MNAYTDPRRMEQIALLAAQRDDELSEIIAPVWPELSLDAGVELVAAMQAYRDHPVRLANDLSVCLIAMMGPRNAALVAEYVTINTAVQ